MAEDHEILTLRCYLEGHLFDFHKDLGAVAIGSGAACSPCMDRLFSVTTTLHPNGERPQTTPKVRKSTMHLGTGRGDRTE